MGNTVQSNGLDWALFDVKTTRLLFRLDEMVEPIDSLQECRFSCELDPRIAQISFQCKAVVNIAVKRDLIRDVHFFEDFFGLVAFGGWK